MRRLLQAIFVAVFIGTLCFVLARVLPGDLAFDIAGYRYHDDSLSAANVAAIRAELGLDRPLYVGWLTWMHSLLGLNFGDSFTTGRPVWYELRLGLTHTIELAAAALAISMAIGVPLGVLAAAKPNGILDRFTLALSVTFRALPPFLVGFVLLVIFAVGTRVLPAGGDTDSDDLLLPAITLAVGLAAVSMRITRTAMLDVIRSDYFQFALTRGSSFRRALVVHGLRNAAVPVITYLGYQAASLIEGVVVVETIFAWPGIGHGLVHAIFGRDIPLIQATALTMALIFVAINTAVDLAGLAIDPRLRT